MKRLQVGQSFWLSGLKSDDPELREGKVILVNNSRALVERKGIHGLELISVCSEANPRPSPAEVRAFEILNTEGNTEPVAVLDHGEVMRRRRAPGAGRKSLRQAESALLGR